MPIDDEFEDNEIERFIDAYMMRLPEMLKEHEGKWIAMRNDDPIGYYENRDEAVDASYDNFGMVPVLVRQVSKEYIEFGRYGGSIEMPGLCYISAEEDIVEERKVA